MGKKIAVVVGVLIALFLAFVAFKSPDYVITRQVTINAPADKIFPYLNNSKKADEWMPWREFDPDSKNQYSGPDEGVGSITTWSGGKKMGRGRATIVDSVPNQKVDIKLEYQDPFPMSQDAEYLVEANGPSSVVHWTVRGQNNFVGRLMSVFMNMDNMVGGMFEKGLANLKALAEKS